jgi:para-nitrobenzyl esterase
MAACSKSPAPEAVQPAGPAVVSTMYGNVSGTVDGDSHAYLGLPFARPPVGELRWAAPAKPDSWTGVRDGSKFGANCYQAEAGRFGPYTPEFMIDSSPVSEDCLYLNVWKPAKGGTGLPVLVFIHGGGFGGGSGSIVIYNGARLAAQDAVVVTVNYRVGAFGFLAHPALRTAGPEGTSGNYGLLDMIASLEWVRDNIAAFGGDPANVTVSGQSAGAMAINALLVAPAAQGLFHRVLTESGTGGGRVAIPLDEAERSGSGLADKLGARTAAELRALTGSLGLGSAQARRTPAAATRPRGRREGRRQRSE